MPVYRAETLRRFPSHTLIWGHEHGNLEQVRSLGIREGLYPANTHHENRQSPLLQQQ